MSDTCPDCGAEKVRDDVTGNFFACGRIDGHTIPDQACGRTAPTLPATDFPETPVEEPDEIVIETGKDGEPVAVHTGADAAAKSRGEDNRGPRKGMMFNLNGWFGVIDEFKFGKGGRLKKVILRSPNKKEFSELSSALAKAQAKMIDDMQKKERAFAMKFLFDALTKLAGD